MGRMTTQAWNGAWVYGDNDESYFRISRRVLHKSNQIGDLGEVRFLPTQFGFCPLRRIPLAVDGGKQTAKRAVSR